MADDDFRDSLGREDFQAHLREMSTDDIKYQPKMGRIANKDKRALAEIDIERPAGHREI